MTLQTPTKSELSSTSVIDLYALRLALWDEIDAANAKQQLAKTARLTHYIKNTISPLIRAQEGLHEAD